MRAVSSCKVQAEYERAREGLEDANQSIKSLQKAHTDSQSQLAKLSSNAVKQAEAARQQVPPEDELNQKCASLVECISMLRASKAVADAEARTCNLWRTRCIEVQSQRDALLP